MMPFYAHERAPKLSKTTFGCVKITFGSFISPWNGCAGRVKTKKNRCNIKARGFTTILVFEAKYGHLQVIRNVKAIFATVTPGRPLIPHCTSKIGFYAVVRDVFDDCRRIFRRVAIEKRRTSPHYSHAAPFTLTSARGARATPRFVVLSCRMIDEDGCRYTVNGRERDGYIQGSLSDRL